MIPKTCKESNIYTIHDVVNEMNRRRFIFTSAWNEATKASELFGRLDDEGKAIAQLMAWRVFTLTVKDDTCPNVS